MNATKSTRLVPAAVSTLPGPPGTVSLSDEVVGAFLDECGLVDAGARSLATKVMLALVQAEADTPFEIRVGHWNINVDRTRLATLASSALVVAGLHAAGVDSQPLLVLAAAVPFLVRTERVRTSSTTVEADLQPEMFTPAGRRQLWTGLPEDIRHEIPIGEFHELTEDLVRLSVRDGDQRVLRAPLSPPEDAAQRPIRVLAVVDRWSSVDGGLSTLNRDLCKALAAAGAVVSCLVAEATADERADSEAANVRLLTAPALPGLGARAGLLRRPPLPPGAEPDVVIGHGRFTGPAARVQVEDHFPNACRVHIVHTAPDELEWLKANRQDEAAARAEERTRLELDLARGSDVSVAIGPRLHGRFLRDSSAVLGAPLPLRLDPGFDGATIDSNRHLRISPTPGSPVQVMLFGRVEDAKIKGIDLAARAFSLARQTLATAIDVELLIRGAAPGTADETRKRVRDWARDPDAPVVVRTYATDGATVAQDLQRASLVLMPSRVEAFGLAGLEAVELGVPALISGRSGLGVLLAELLPAELADQIVIPVTNDEDVDASTWANAIERILRDRSAAFDQAARVRNVMAQQRTWAGAARRLLRAVRTRTPRCAVTQTTGL